MGRNCVPPPLGACVSLPICKMWSNAGLEGGQRAVLKSFDVPWGAWCTSVNPRSSQEVVKMTLSQVKLCQGREARVHHLARYHVGLEWPCSFRRGPWYVGGSLCLGLVVWHRRTSSCRNRHGCGQRQGLHTKVGARPNVGTAAVPSSRTQHSGATTALWS